MIRDLGSRNHVVEVQAGGNGPDRGPAGTQGARRAQAAERQTMRGLDNDDDTTMMLMGHKRANTARVHGQAKEQERVCTGLGQQDSTQSSVRTKTRGGQGQETRKKLMFAAGRLDTIYLLWENPSGDLSRNAGYLRVPS